MKILKKKYIVMFVKRELNSYEILSVKRISAISKQVIFNKKPYPINTSNQTCSKGLKLFFLIDITKKCQLYFDTTNIQSMDIDVIDMIMEKHILKDLTTNMTDHSYLTMNILSLAIGIAIGAMAGFIVGNYIPLGVDT